VQSCTTQTRRKWLYFRPCCWCFRQATAIHLYVVCTRATSLRRVITHRAVWILWMALPAARYCWWNYEWTLYSTSFHMLSARPPTQRSPTVHRCQTSEIYEWTRHSFGGEKEWGVTFTRVCNRWMECLKKLRWQDGQATAAPRRSS